MPPDHGRRYDLVALDVAGTTVEEHGAVYEALADAVRAAGARPSQADLRRWMGADKLEAVQGLLSGGGGSPDASVVQDTYGDFRRRLASAYAQHPPEPLPGVPEALRELRDAGVQVVLTTGFSRDVTDDLLQTVGWAATGDAGRRVPTVDAVVCAEDVGAGRPAPYMVFEGMRRTGVHDVRRVLVAGDTVLDLRAGSNAGAGAVVGVLTGAMDAAALGRERHTHLLASVAQLPTLVLV